MGSTVKSLEVLGLHGRNDVSLDFWPDVNIVYGQNGTGKTTMLHILANLLNGDLERFAFLDFDTVRLTTYEGDLVVISRIDNTGDQSSRIHIRSEQGGAELEFDVREVQEELRRSDEPRTETPLLDAIDSFTATSFGAEATYFPAFRMMIEAWSSARLTDDLRRLRRHAPVDEIDAERDEYYFARRAMAGRAPRSIRLISEFARDLFGNFVPSVNYPSPLEIEYQLQQRVEESTFSVVAKDREILSTAFLDAFAALSPGKDLTPDSPDKILEDIRQALEGLNEGQTSNDLNALSSSRVYSQLQQVASDLSGVELSEAASNVLSVYRRSLYERTKFQRNVFEPIEKYVSSVNDFLDTKKVVVRRSEDALRGSYVGLKFDDGGEARLRTMSSGERQIVSMLYAALDKDLGEVVLVDEPELSLHIDWQRMLIKRMASLIGKRQIIVCTHSPEIGADFEDRYQELIPQRSDVSSS